MAHVHEKEVIECGVAGVVKWFNVKNGYGFIKRYDTGNDVFVHRTAILSQKRIRSVGDGEIVQFDVAIGEKGLEAINVTGPNGQPVKGSPYALSRMKRRRRFAYSYHDSRREEGRYTSSSAPNLGVEFRATRVIEHHQTSWHTLPLAKSEWQLYAKKAQPEENDSVDSDKSIAPSKPITPRRYSSCSSDLNVRHTGRSHRRRIPATSRSSSESDSATDNTSDEPTSSTESTNSDHGTASINHGPLQPSKTPFANKSSPGNKNINLDINKNRLLTHNTSWRRMVRINPTR